MEKGVVLVALDRLEWYNSWCRNFAVTSLHNVDGTEWVRMKKKNNYNTTEKEVFEDFEFIDLDADENALDYEESTASIPTGTEKYLPPKTEEILLELTDISMPEGLEMVDLDSDVEMSKELTDPYQNAPDHEIGYEDELIDAVKKSVHKQQEQKEKNTSKERKKAAAGLSIGERINAFFQGFFSNFTKMDGVVWGFGIFVLIVVIVVVGIGVKRMNGGDESVPALAQTGRQLSEIGIAGESGLMAVADAQLNKQTIVQTTPEPTEMPEEGEVVEVRVNFTSVEKDLKIKFVNDETGKLVNNAAFVVILTDASGNDTTYTDNDMDGIIYNATMTPGTYSVEVQAPEDYEIVKCDSSVVVRDTIVYEQIDVEDEIKTEAEVDVSVEDTQMNVEIEEEIVTGDLADTVEWVESTRTTIGNEAGFAEVPKSSVVDPTLVVGRTVVAMTTSAVRVVGTIVPTPDITGEGTQPATEQGDVTITPTDSAATPTESVTETPSETPSATPSAMPTEAPGATDTPTVTPTEVPAVTVAKVTIDKGSAELTVGGEMLSLTATVTMSDDTTQTSAQSGVVTWSSSDSNIATVDENGKVTGIAAGTATITATSVQKSSDGKTVTATCSVTVTATTFTVKLNKEKAELYVGNTLTLVATVNKNGTETTSATAGVVTWTSSDTAVATVNEKTGEITALKAGTVTITATTVEKDGSGKQVSVSCTLTVLATKLEIEIDKTTASMYTDAKLTPVVTVTKNGEVTTSATVGVVTWSSSDTAIATVNEKTGEITALKAGTVTITATTVEVGADGKPLSVSCKITVRTNPQKDRETKLIDNRGNQVYVLDSAGNYVEAVSADYFTANKFYIKSEIQYRYTGWQTIDNKTYYYDKNGNFVTGEQVIQGVKYNFASDGVLSMGNGVFGIDVSKWNGTINWTAVKNSGVSFVIIRCGFRGSTQGGLIEDSMFRQNIQGAIDAGLNVGVYFFSQAVNEVEAVEEASMVLSMVKNYRISYPIFIDTEPSGGRADSISKETRTAVCKAFCETIRNAGYTAGIYASKSWFTTKLDMSVLSAYKIWLAQYATTPTYTGRYDMWQYSDKGTISGISGNVDVNYSYLGY